MPLLINDRKTTIHSMLLSDGTVLKSPKEIHLRATKYFPNYLTESSNPEYADLSQLQERVVTNEENYLP